MSEDLAIMLVFIIVMTVFIVVRFFTIKMIRETNKELTKLAKLLERFVGKPVEKKKGKYSNIIDAKFVRDTIRDILLVFLTIALTLIFVT